MKGKVEIVDLGFVHKKSNKSKEILWSEIECIYAFKSDNLTTDEICIEIKTKGDAILISEESNGFDLLKESLQNELQLLVPNWYLEIVKPAFLELKTKVFDRSFANNVELVDSIEIVKKEIQRASLDLLKLIEENCWNKVSQSIVYVISEIKNEEDVDKKYIIDLPKTLSQVALEIFKLKAEIYNINVFYHKSETAFTILELEYYPNRLVKEQFQEKDKTLTVGAKLTLPPYHKTGKKFSLNWQTKKYKLKIAKYWFQLKCYLRKVYVV